MSWTDREEGQRVQGGRFGSGQSRGDQRRHVWISGRVQGVFFRQSCAMEAPKHQVTGWVRNLSDGRVEAVFEGSTAAVEAMVQWCRSGPTYARVSDVVVKSETPEGYEGFEVRGTGNL